MAIQYIEIGPDTSSRRPIVKLTESSPGSIWQYMGSCIGGLSHERGVGRLHDLNCAAEAAAAALAEKVSGRNITVELLIDPMIPPLFVEIEKVVPILTLIAENASASVEPGPGTVLLKTWCTEHFIGVDAIGRNGHVPVAVRDSWRLPGFSTRVAEWDTGFGLHAAIQAADAIAARIELLEQTEAVAFRLAIPLNAEIPPSSAEALVGTPTLNMADPGYVLSDDDTPRYSVVGLFGGVEDVRFEGTIQA